LIITFLFPGAGVPVSTRVIDRETPRGRAGAGVATADPLGPAAGAASAPAPRTGLGDRRPASPFSEPGARRDGRAAPAAAAPGRPPCFAPPPGREPPGDAFDGFVPPAFWPSAMHFWNIIAPLEHFCCYRFAHRNPRCARTTAPEGGIFG